MVMVSGGGGNAWAKEMTIRRRIASMCAPHPDAISLLFVRKGILFYQAANYHYLYGFGFRFNKTQEHFPTLKDYNDYLEEVEDMSELFPLFVNLLFLNYTNWEKLSRFDFSFQAFNLIEGIDVEAIEAKIARYQQENAEQIYLSRAKRVCFVMIPDVVLWSTEIPVEMFYSNL